MALSVTDSDGRCLDLLPPRDSDAAKQQKTDLVAGMQYKIIFKTKDYFDRTNRKTFYPCAEVNSTCSEPAGTDIGTPDTVHHWESRRALPHPTSNQPILLYDLQGELRDDPK
jgi:hypothetical protein